jgi:hypothetical protein
LKTFLTQIRPTLPLTPDPPVICFWKWIRWNDYEVPKNRNLENASAKNEIFFSPTRHIPTLCTRRAKFPFPVAAHSPTPRKKKNRRCQKNSRNRASLELCCSSAAATTSARCRTAASRAPNVARRKRHGGAGRREGRAQEQAAPPRPPRARRRGRGHRPPPPSRARWWICPRAPVGE